MLSDLAVQAAGRPVTVRGPEGTFLELAPEDLAAAADALSRAIVPTESRQILVLSTALDDPATRAVLAWATVNGAALLLEPDPGSVLGAAVWARPTLFLGSMDEIARLRRAAENQETGWLRRHLRPRNRPRLPFGRLRTVLSTEPGPLPADDESFWQDRGVRVRFLPQCGIAWYIRPRGDRHA